MREPHRRLFTQLMRETDTTPQASGVQIAFLILAVGLLSAPAAQWFASASSWGRENDRLIGRFVMFTLAVAVLGGFAALRRTCVHMLSQPIGADHRAEAWAIAVIAVLGNFAMAGSVAVWLWLQGGDALLASEVQVRHDAAYARATSAAGLLLIPLAWLLGPVVEEIVFRGFLYRAWARRWNWIISATLTSVVFGIYHPFFVASFCYSILFTCVVRRTGSLRSSIAAHAVSNMSLWFPFLGQFIFPANAGDGISRISTWWFHLACLLAFAVFLPIYVWMSRDAALKRDAG